MSLSKSSSTVSTVISLLSSPVPPVVKITSISSSTISLIVLINASLSSGIIILDFKVYLFDVSSARYCPDKSSSFVVMLSLNVITPQVISVDDNFLFFRILHDFLAVNL